jgi:hypothetical protein
MVMIDGIRPRRRKSGHLRPVDRQLFSSAVIGRHASEGTHRPEPKPAQHFTPPAAVEAVEEQRAETSTTGKLSEQKSGKRRSFKEWLKDRSKKQWIIFAAVLVLLAGGASAWFFMQDDAPVAKKKVATPQQEEKPPEPVMVPSTLTGMPVDPSVNERSVTAIMIENTEEARPQSGLEHAGVVFEAIAEGGITRFLTLFHDTEPGYIGPVRSVRPYYIRWAMGFDAGIAHVGGSPEALASMKQWKAKDLDQFAGGSYFYRISSRYAPHNVYTDMGKLHAYEAQKGFGKSNFTPIVRKAQQASKTPSVTSIDFNVSSAFYNPHYDYDVATNSYKRSEGGAPHMQADQNGGQLQLAPKVVVALIMAQGASGKYTTYNTIGTGTAFIFQDGIMVQGNWRKDSNESQFVFTTQAGAPLALNAGQTWFTVLGGSDRVTYR